MIGPLIAAAGGALINKLIDRGTNKVVDKIEGVKLEVWNERVWFCIENNGLLPD